MQCFQSLTSMLRLIYCAHFASLSYSSTSLHGVTVSHRYLSLPVCYHLILIFSNHQRGCSIIKLESFSFTQHIELSDVFDTFPKNYVYTEIRSLCTLHTAEDILAFNNALVYTAWLPLHRNWVKLVTLLVIWLLSIIVPLVSKEW